jgi:hypothetical protein
LLFLKKGLLYLCRFEIVKISPVENHSFKPPIRYQYPVIVRPAPDSCSVTERRHFNIPGFQRITLPPDCGAAEAGVFQWRKAAESGRGRR